MEQPQQQYLQQPPQQQQQQQQQQQRVGLTAPPPMLLQQSMSNSSSYQPQFNSGAFQPPPPIGAQSTIATAAATSAFNPIQSAALQRPPPSFQQLNNRQQPNNSNNTSPSPLLFQNNLNQQMSNLNLSTNNNNNNNNNNMQPSQLQQSTSSPTQQILNNLNRTGSPFSVTSQQQQQQQQQGPPLLNQPAYQQYNGIQQNQLSSAPNQNTNLGYGAPPASSGSNQAQYMSRPPMMMQPTQPQQQPFGVGPPKPPTLQTAPFGGMQHQHQHQQGMMMQTPSPQPGPPMYSGPPLPGSTSSSSIRPPQLPFGGAHYPNPSAGTSMPPGAQNTPPPPPMGNLNQMYDQNQVHQQQQQQQPQQQQQQPHQQSSQSKMDMDQIPNPIEVMMANSAKHSGDFETNEPGKIPPLITTDFVCKDLGNCNPRFIRSSVYSVPANPDIMKQTKMPLVLNLTPFANLKPGEREPPVSNLGELGPVRCKRCKAYMSPFMTFIDNGKKFTCPFCDDVTQVPQEYFNHLDHMGRRIDIYERPELCLGSYEFVATKDYCRQQTLPQAPAFIFMIDVSVNSVRSGLLHVLCPYIKNVILPNLPTDISISDNNNNNKNSEIRVAFVTYDKELHFYNLKNTLAAPQMMIVSDVEEVFVPILDGFLVKMSESKSVVDTLLDTLPIMFEENKETELIFGPVVEAGIEALKVARHAGKLFIFHSNLPNALAPGQLKNRDDKKLLGTEKEKQVLTSQNDYYGQLAKKCIENGCSVDLFLLPNQYCDLATLGDIGKKSGGQIYKYEFFTADIQGQRLCDDLKYAIESSVAFDAVMKIRTSTGIKPIDYLGNFNMYGNDIEICGLQRQTSLCVELKHEDKLNENGKCFIQLALLYTSLSGQRRIRIHNLSLNVCNQYSQLFSSCELDTLINYIAKLACRSITLSNPKSIKENLINQVASILASYRKNCTNTPSKGQFILPETLKLLPVFSNSLLKSDAITGCQNITIDERAWLMHRIMSMDIESTYAYFYPRLLPLHEIETDNVEVLPTPVRCIYERLKDDGIYLLENGLVMFLWIGVAVDPSVIQNLFGVAGSQQLNTEKCKLLELNTKISENVRAVIRIINEQRKSNLRLIVVRQRDNLEIFFKNLLVEDKGFMPNGSSYVDFLYQLHREIKNILS